jgi:hypothetical protein
MHSITTLLLTDPNKLCTIKIPVEGALTLQQHGTVCCRCMKGTFLFCGVNRHTLNT